MFNRSNTTKSPKTSVGFHDFSIDTAASSLSGPLSSGISLPSLVSGNKDFFDVTDFAGSVPSIPDNKASLFGAIPVFRRFNILSNSPEKEKKHTLRGDDDEWERYVDANGRKRKRKKRKEVVVASRSMLGDGFKFDEEKKTVYVRPKRKTALPSSKKLSKHSTTGRKLKPDKIIKDIGPDHSPGPKKKIKEFTRIPGPLPRVFQRAKLNREMTSIMSAIKSKKNSDEPVELKKTKITLKSAARSMITALRAETDKSATYWDKFFGDGARVDFYEKYKAAGRQFLSHMEQDLPTDGALSPRAKYLKKVVHDDLLPLPLLLRKQHEAKGIFLGHKGLGDAKMLPVIHVLEDLPTVESIDFSDNRLTDESLMPLALKLTKLETLTSLNLSDNKIDDSSQVIMDYLRNKNCKLKCLWLDAADVDDSECGNLAQAIMENKSIEMLSLRNNLIGKDELLNVVYPDLETGGEALGEMLCHNETITELDVSWNFIRLDSACQFADSLLLNSTLVTLKLAYNAFGDEPTQCLGKALKENTTLEYLDVQYNSITPRAATVLANALLHNDTIETLILDGNVLGDVGSQAVVAAIQRSSNESRNLNISFSNCDCKRVVTDVFNASNPAGVYTLDLSEPYGQMVCEEIMYLANYRAGCVLNSLQHRPKGESKFKNITLQRPVPATAIFQKNCVATQKEFAKLVLDIVGKRIKAAAKHSSKPSSRSNQRNKSKPAKEPANDNSRSARIARRRADVEEVVIEEPEEDPDADVGKAADLCKKMLEQFDLFPDDSLHMEVVEELLFEVEEKLMVCTKKVEFKEDFLCGVLYHIFFALFQLNDADLSGDMDLDEFLTCLSCLGVEFDRKYAKKLLRDFDVDKSGLIDNQEFAMIMVNEFCRLDISRDELIDSSTKRPWVIPSSGEVTLSVNYQCEMPSIYDVSHDEGIMGVIKCIRFVQTDEQRETIFLNATTSPYFYMSAQQALMLFEEMGKHDESRLDVLSRVLPQLVSPEQCHRFIDSVLNPEGKFALRVKMGQSYNVFMGLYSGHYVYDLKHVQKQQEGRALSAVWSEEMMYMKRHRCDTSQRGNYSNFRNETYSGNPVPITSTWFAACPTSGKLRLDYISTMRPKQGNWPLSKKRFASMKKMLGLASIMEIYKSQDFARVKSSKSGKKRLSTANAHLSNKESKALYRAASSVEGIVPESVKSPRVQGAESAETTSTPPTTPSTADITNAADLLADVDSMLTLGAIKEFYMGYMESCHHYHSIYPEERQRDVSRADYDPNARPVTPENLRDRDTRPSLTKYDKIFPYAYMKLLKLQLALPTMFLSIDQVMDIILMFPPVDYLRVQAFVSMFSRIVDFDKNGVRILDVLSRDDQSELFHRVGILNIMDPMSPDRLYRLDLRRWDHREACKIMIQLAIIEPGDNWVGEEYRWSKYDGNVPGWTLPMQWTTPDEVNYGDGGPRRHGWCSFTYTSTDPGCAPNWSLRREQRKRVLVGIKRNT
mmetsp:Transcript_15285/g.25407  ORF Transcript_15285/g.25407 Transcript_15285/m.25407 type:complete len:1484 (+) Transcript_15285:120-4571(+)